MAKHLRDDATGSFKEAPARLPASGHYTASSTSKTVRNPNTGRYVEVKGAGSLSGHALPIKKGVDLTKPIYEQVSRRR